MLEELSLWLKLPRRSLMKQPGKSMTSLLMLMEQSCLRAPRPEEPRRDWSRTWRRTLTRVKLTTKSIWFKNVTKIININSGTWTQWQRRSGGWRTGFRSWTRRCVMERRAETTPVMTCVEEQGVASVETCLVARERSPSLKMLSRTPRMLNNFSRRKILKLRQVNR